APSFDHAVPMARDVAGCVRLMEALVPGFAVEPIEAREVPVGVTWQEEADDGVRSWLLSSLVVVSNWRGGAFPEPDGTTPVFMHEVAGVHRELIEEHGELYGDNPRTKIERCLAVTDSEAEAAQAARREYEQLAFAAFSGVDLLLAPTLMFVAPP